MRKVRAVAVVLAAIIAMSFPFTSYAEEVKEIIAEGEYIMGDGETMSVAEERAQKNAARSAAEQAGAFVKSYTKVKNLTLRSDVIEVVANHTMKISILNKRREMRGDAVRFYVKIKAVMSAKDIDDNLKKLQSDGSIVDAYKKLQADFDRQKKEMDALKTQLASAAGGEKKTILARIGNDERRFKANLWLEEAQKRSWPSNKAEWQRAIDAYTKAIELNPDLVDAYLGRGKMLLGDKEEWKVENAGTLPDRALSDYNRAIELDTRNPRAYHGRMEALNAWAQTERRKDAALTELSAKMDRLAEKGDKEALNESEIKLMLDLNAAMHRIDDKYLSRAFQDIDRAISLKPDEPSFYEARAILYAHADDCWLKTIAKLKKASCDRAIADMTKAIALASTLPDRSPFSTLYARRGMFYNFNGDEELAKRDSKEFEKLANQPRAQADLPADRPTGYIVNEKELKECEAKLRTLDQAIAKDPDDPENHLEKVRALSTIGLYLMERGQSNEKIDAEKLKHNNLAIELMERKGADEFGYSLASAYLIRLTFYRLYRTGQEGPHDSEVKDLSRIIELQDIIHREKMQAFKVSSVVDLRRSMANEAERLRKAGERDEAEMLSSSVGYIDTYLKNSLVKRAEILEKLGLPEKAYADYAKVCSGWNDEGACKAARRLK